MSVLRGMHRSESGVVEMKLAIGTDHAAFELKQAIRGIIEEMGHELVDFGCHSTESCNHADFSIPVAEAVARGEFEGAILACGTGQAMAIGANKVKGIRATLCMTPDMARLARQHNNSNILVLSGRFVSPDEAVAIFKAWASSSYEGGRHAVRMDTILRYESQGR
jgi:ribose 5-phosphate isomerase B